jgi:hypothetical protein
VDRPEKIFRIERFGKFEILSRGWKNKNPRKRV